MVFLRSGALTGALLLLGCKPDITDRASLVQTPRVLAVAANPPEAEELSAVSYSALVVDGTGQAPPFVVDWALCIARKPLAELEPFNPICVSRVGDFLVPLGEGSAASGAIPSNACRLFGPEVPPPKKGEPFGRPTDPDTTGGYYQPVRVILAADTGDVASIGASRLACGVAGASSGDSTAFRQRYHYNATPTISALTVNGAPVGQDEASATPIPAGSVAHFEADWIACPAVDVCGDGVCGPEESSIDCPADCKTGGGCAGAERYLFYDTEQQMNVDRRETIRVSWFTTAGSFTVDTSGRDENDTSTNATDDLTLPTQPGRVYGWAVMRDSRGGTSWKSWVLDVQ